VALATLAADGALEIPGVCLNPTRTGFLRALTRMGADISEDNVVESGGDDVGTLLVRPAPLADLAIAGSEIPSMIDELPLLACVAAGAGVELQITGAAELRVKESDRIKAIVQNLVAIGGAAEELSDGFRILRGKRELRGVVETRGDHRIAMAFGILSRLPGNVIEIRGRDCVGISYPRFWDDLDRVAS
jgi:3-phosphoshikimate 1-carboxyvinyltransferase